jgi:hypothetical protein
MFIDNDKENKIWLFVLSLLCLLERLYDNSTTMSSIFVYILFLISQIDIMKRKLKQWWSTIPPISTKRTSISHLNWFSTKKRAYDLGNLGPGLVTLSNRLSARIVQLVCGGSRFSTMYVMVDPFTYDGTRPGPHVNERLPILLFRCMWDLAW